MSDTFDCVKLGDVAEITMGQSPDSQYVEEGLENGTPFLQGNAEFGDHYPTPKYSCSQPGKTAREGDVLVSVRAPVGEVNLADRRYCIGRGLSAIRFTSVPSSLGQKLIAYFGVALSRVAQGTTFEAINRDELSSLLLQLPPPDEQPIIARILDTLDTQIRRTEALIAKLEQIKQGLLTDLLTRGIDENGELRQPPEEAPHLYKDSPLGLIPRNWEFKRLGDVIAQYGGLIQTGPFGSQLHAHEYVEHGVPVVMPQDMRKIEVSTRNIAQVTDHRARELRRHRTQVNDLLFSRRGDLSRCSFVGKNQEGWLCGTGCLLVRLPRNIVNGYWLAHTYKQPSVQSQVLGMAVGSTMINLNSGILANIHLAVPPIDEQNSFETRIRSANARLEREQRERTKLNDARAGLMDDLLTGRVRVTSLLDESAQATG